MIDKHLRKKTRHGDGEFLKTITGSTGESSTEELAAFQSGENISEWKNSTLHRCVPWNAELQKQAAVAKEHSHAITIRINGLRFLTAAKECDRMVAEAVKRRI